MLKAALLLGFFGFLRVSEFTTPSRSHFNPRIHPIRSDICLSHNRLTFNLKRSKTDQSARGFLLTIGTTRNNLCPITALGAYFSTCHHTPNGLAVPLFHFSSGQPLSRARFLRHFRTLLSQAGHDASHFNTHSLRIGAATSAARAGLPLSTIQHLGRWRSSCYKTYIRSLPSTWLKAAAAMSRPY